MEDVSVFSAFVGMCSLTCELVYYCLERRAAYHMDVNALLSVPLVLCMCVLAYYWHARLAAYHMGVSVSFKVSMTCVCVICFGQIVYV